jgi:hypothetical protein
MTNGKKDRGKDHFRLFLDIKTDIDLKATEEENIRSPLVPKQNPSKSWSLSFHASIKLGMCRRAQRRKVLSLSFNNPIEFCVISQKFMKAKSFAILL